MKKKLLLGVTLVLSLFVLQSCEALRVVTLIISGQKASITSDDPYTSWEDPIGGQIGVGVPLVNFNESVGLRAEANLSLQGAGWKESEMEGKTNLLYFNIPVLARYQMKNGFFGEAGLQPGLLLSAMDKWDGGSESYMDHMNKFDLSVPVGIGYEFKNNLGIGFRVIPGINDITADADAKDRNLLFALRGTYTFKFKK